MPTQQTPPASTPAEKRATVPSADRVPARNTLASLILIALWFGVFAGLIEGCLLLLFQRINWERWGAVAHVSREIIWISPVVDAILFLLVALIVAACARLIPRVPSIRAALFALVFISVYDWLTLTERITHHACQLLALGVAVAFGRWFWRNSDRLLRFWQRSFIWLCVACLLVFAGIQGGTKLRERHELANLPSAAAGSPNVLVIVVDTLRADHLSAYGYSRPTTPHFDHLAAEGTLFENAYSACSWTLPSHASLLTGRYPSDHDWQNVHPMPWTGWGRSSLRGYTTLGEALQQKGYRTGAFSANQLYFTAGVGLGRGFIRFEDYFQSAQDMFLHTLYGREFDRVYLHRTERSKITRGLRAVGLSSLLDDRKRANEVNREALAWIDAGQRPFLAFLNYIDVHDSTSLQWPHSPPRWGEANPIDTYDSAVSYVDEEIGNLIQELDRRGLTKNTLVIITSDHGEGLGQHSMQFHGIGLFREQIHVPLLIRFPEHVPAGMRIGAPVSNAALAATIVDLVGGDAHIFPGAGLNALWSTSGQSNWPYPISELQKNRIDDRDMQARNVEPTAMDGDMKSVVTPKWHLIAHQTMGAQIYDWTQDPGELRNLINTPEGQAAAKGLERELQGEHIP